MQHAPCIHHHAKFLGMRIFLCSLRKKHSRNKLYKKANDKNLRFFCQFNRQKQQASLAQGVRPVTQKRLAWIQTEIGAEKDGESAVVNKMGICLSSSSVLHFFPFVRYLYLPYVLYSLLHFFLR